MKRWIIFIIVALIFVVGGILVVKHRIHQLKSIKIETKLPVPVDTAKIKKGTFKEYKLYLGTLSSNRQAVVRSRIQGQVGEILKREGDSVKKGDVLVILDGINGSSFGTREALLKSIKAQKKSLQDMKKAVENFKRMYQRDLALYQNKAISKQALELSENRLKEAEVNLEKIKVSIANLKEKLSFLTIKSPFTGVVSKVKVNIGDIVMPSMPVIEIENKDNCKVVVSVSSDDIPNIKEGEDAKLLYNGKELDCSVSRVYPSVKETGIGTVEIYFNSHPFNLPLGSKVSVKIPVKILDNVLIVPDNGVLTSASKNILFKVVDGKVEPVNVEILGASDNSYAVNGEIKEGDVIVVGSDSLLMRLKKGTHVLVSKGE